MTKAAFDNNKYLQMQSAHIRERIAQFGGKRCGRTAFAGIYRYQTPLLSFPLPLSQKLSTILPYPTGNSKAISRENLLFRGIASCFGNGAVL